MTAHDADLVFPRCCVYCPYRKEVRASCTHSMRQSLVRELDPAWTCPVFSEVKTTAMRQLLDAVAH